jgi:ATP-dependent RNA helicase DDX27
MSLIQTIGSDDEIDEEEMSGEETNEEYQNPKSGNSRNQKKKKSLFSLEFDDGEGTYEIKYARVKQVEKYKANESNDFLVSGEMDATSSDADDDSDGSLSDEESSESENDAEGASDKSASNEIESGAEDVVRLMPRTEERAARALLKVEKREERAKQSKKNKTQDSDEDSDDEVGMESSDDSDAGMNEKEEAGYFDSVMAQEKDKSDSMFSQLNLSRPLLRAIESAGYVNPTPIQAHVIPVALAGRDVCASAVTGSGKTAAFVLPFLERLLFRPKDTAVIRVLVVSPTRELATQIFLVLKALSQFTDVTSTLICGGKKDVNSQSSVLRNRPDVVVCTPGRIIDHLRNSQSVNLEGLDVLVLDEVDKLLDLGFEAEIEELLRHCPLSRQTLLFSATMTTKVDDLAKLSLKKPVRIKMAAGSRTIAPRLEQQFVKVRKEDEREAMAAALVVRHFSKRCIVFFDTKKNCHRFCLLLRLLGVKSSELHGDISQVERNLSLQRFKDGNVDVLIATDVAARGLDIQGVNSVVNVEMPRDASTYIHRVGRTARAGKSGTAITLVGDARRKVMKEVLKGASAGEKRSGDFGKVLSRSIPAATVSKFTTKIIELEDALEEALKEGYARARMEIAEQEAEKASNTILFESEIKSRPQRTWHMSKEDKQKVQDRSTAAVREAEKIAEHGKPIQTTSQRGHRREEYFEEIKEKKKKGEHKLSRKKRRRVLALEESDAATNADGIADVEVYRTPKGTLNATKRKSADEKEELLNKGRKPGAGSNGLIKRQTFAVGGLDQDMLNWGAGGVKLSTKSSKKRQAEEEFTEFDPNKRLRKQGKLGKHAFKSKAKYKRRK